MSSALGLQLGVDGDAHLGALRGRGDREQKVARCVAGDPYAAASRHPPGPHLDAAPGRRAEPELLCKIGALALALRQLQEHGIAANGSTVRELDVVRRLPRPVRRSTFADSTGIPAAARVAVSGGVAPSVNSTTSSD